MKVVAVETTATLRIATRHGKKAHHDFTGVFAATEEAIAPFVQRIPHHVKVLDREPTEAELEAARSVGLIPGEDAGQEPAGEPAGEPDAGQEPAQTATAAGDDQTPTGDTGRAFKDILADDLREIASALALDTDGNRKEVYKRVSAYAEINNINLDGSVEDVTARLTPAAQE